MWAPLLGKAIKLLFSISPKTLSPRFNLAPVYKEAELLASLVRGQLKPPRPFWVGSQSCVGGAGQTQREREARIQTGPGRGQSSL